MAGNLVLKALKGPMAAYGLYHIKLIVTSGVRGPTFVAHLVLQEGLRGDVGRRSAQGSQSWVSVEAFSVPEASAFMETIGPKNDSTL